MSKEQDESSADASVTNQRGSALQSPDTPYPKGKQFAAIFTGAAFAAFVTGFVSDIFTAYLI